MIKVLQFDVPFFIFHVVFFILCSMFHCKWSILNEMKNEKYNMHNGTLIFSAGPGIF